jgi:hypothetical protein
VRPGPAGSIDITERAIRHGPVPNVIVASQHRASERMRMVRGVRACVRGGPGAPGPAAGVECSGAEILDWRYRRAGEHSGGWALEGGRLQRQQLLKIDVAVR